MERIPNPAVLAFLHREIADRHDADKPIILDDWEAALVKIKEYIEDPAWMLLES